MGSELSQAKPIQQLNDAPDPRLEFDSETHTYRYDGVVKPSVTQILVAAGVCDPSRYQNAPYCASRGHAFHVAAAYDDEDDLDDRTVAPEIWARVEAYRGWKAGHQHRWLHIERRRYQPQYDYAGTPDRDGELKLLGGMRNVVVDFKTGVKEDHHRIQLAAYAYLLPNPFVTRVSLYFGADGRYTMEIFDVTSLAADFHKFLDALERARGETSLFCLTMH